MTLLSADGGVNLIIFFLRLLFFFLFFRFWSSSLLRLIMNHFREMMMNYYLNNIYFCAYFCVSNVLDTLFFPKNILARYYFAASSDKTCLDSFFFTYFYELLWMKCLRDDWHEITLESYHHVLFSIVFSFSYYAIFCQKCQL